MRIIFSGLILIFWCVNIYAQRTLKKILRSQPILKEVSSNKKTYRVQIIYTTVDHNKKGELVFNDYKFNVDTSIYFYPASTVKLLVSALAMEALDAETEGRITAAAPLKAFAIGPCQTSEVYDSSSFNLQPSISQYIRKMLLVSDNAAYNRVFDFAGQDYLQRRLNELGFENARIIQRFDPGCNPAANRFHNRFEFYGLDSTFLFSHTASTSKVYINPVKKAEAGKGYYYGDSLVQQPRSFRYNNNLPLEVTHQSLMRIIFPYSFPDSLQFKLQRYEFRDLKSVLGQYPYESDFPKYDTSYFPAYKKYLYYGKNRNAVIDSGLRIYNIVGQAYGFTTDVAYFEDIKNNVSFFLSATIYTNADEILNDDKYEYDTIAFPFMKALGQEVYERELKRSKKKN